MKFIPIFAIALITSISGCSLERNMRLIVAHDGEVAEICSEGNNAHKLPAELKEIVSVGVGPDGRLLVVSAKGLVCILTDDMSKIENRIAKDAIAAAWSNAGGQIAVLCSPEGSGSREAILYLYDFNRKIISSRSISITKPAEVDKKRDLDWPYNWKFALSWSADDRFLAMSTRSRGILKASECVLFDLSKQRQYLKTGISNVYFINDRTIAANTDIEGRCTQLFDVELQSGRLILKMLPLELNGFLVGADSKAKRIAIWKRDPNPILRLSPLYCYGSYRIYDENGRSYGSTNNEYFWGWSACLQKK